VTVAAVDQARAELPALASAINYKIEVFGDVVTAAHRSAEAELLGVKDIRSRIAPTDMRLPEGVEDCTLIIDIFSGAWSEKSQDPPTLEDDSPAYKSAGDMYRKPAPVKVSEPEPVAEDDDAPAYKSAGSVIETLKAQSLERREKREREQALAGLAAEMTEYYLSRADRRIDRDVHGQIPAGFVQDRCSELGCDWQKYLKVYARMAMATMGDLTWACRLDADDEHTKKVREAVEKEIRWELDTAARSARYAAELELQLTADFAEIDLGNPMAWHSKIPKTLPENITALEVIDALANWIRADARASILVGKNTIDDLCNRWGVPPLKAEYDISLMLATAS